MFVNCLLVSLVYKVYNYLRHNVFLLGAAFCNHKRKSHKGIVIGKKGAMLKEVSTNARHELEQFFDCKVNLQCWVKVKEDWRNREGLIHNFGLD